jgi:ABC-type multidrug transport system ATPase subunit
VDPHPAEDLAAEGRTVFLSSHLMSEVEHTADHLVVIGRGRIIADVAMADFITQASGTKVRVVSPDATALRNVLAGPDVTIHYREPNDRTRDREGRLMTTKADAAQNPAPAGVPRAGGRGIRRSALHRCTRRSL